MKRKQFGFTLVELLTVVAIIGILAAILIPAVSNGLKRSRQVAAMANAGGVASAYQSYLIDRGRSMSPDSIESVGDFAARLAEFDYLASAEPFFISDDPLAPDPIPRSLAAKQGEEWKATEPFSSVNAYSLDVAIGISPHHATSTTPMLWTRGLTTSGEWSEDAVWENRGFMIYADGHSEMIDTMGTGENALLLHYTNRTPTANVLQALPSRVVVRGKGSGSLNGQSGVGN